MFKVGDRVLCPENSPATVHAVNQDGKFRLQWDNAEWVGAVWWSESDGFIRESSIAPVSPDGFLYEFDRDGPPGRRLWQMQPNLPGRWLPQIQDMSTDELRYVAAFIDEEVSK